MLEPYIIDSVLPVGAHSRLRFLLEHAEWRFGWVSNKDIHQPFFNKVFTKTDAKDNRLDLSAELTEGPVAEAWAWISGNHLPGYKLLRCYANAQVYGLEGYPHTDSDVDTDVTCMLYFCKRYEQHHGGETVVYDARGDIVKSCVPRKNRAFVIPAASVHQARAVTREYRELRITLMFKLGR